jgi:hypothetical protein
MRRRAKRFSECKRRGPAGRGDLHCANDVAPPGMDVRGPPRPPPYRASPYAGGRRLCSAGRRRLPTADGCAPPGEVFAGGERLRSAAQDVSEEERLGQGSAAVDEGLRSNRAKISP